MTQPVPDYSEFVNKKVTIQLATGDGVEEIDGTLKLATPGGIMFQKRGTGIPVMYLPEAVLGVVPTAEEESKPKKVRKLKPRYMKEVDSSQVRAHLATNHGFLLGDVNVMTEAEAEAIHNDQHTTHGLNLGHAHGEKPASDADSERGRAVAAESGDLLLDPEENDRDDVEVDPIDQSEEW